MIKYLAHISDDNREQTLSEHLCRTSELCSEFASAFGAKKQGELVGMMHDIGKYSEGFQRRLKGGPKVDHSTAGAIECAKIRQLAASLCIAGHHTGLPDLGTRTMLEGSSLNARLNRTKNNPLLHYEAWRTEISIPESDTPAYVTDNLKGSFYSRMLYSCLVDADFIDTEEFMLGEKRQHFKVDFELLNNRIDAQTRKWYPPKGELNRLRCDILKNCIEQGEGTESGLFTLTVPTGGGKTIASLAFALRHARAQKKERIIYVIPYNSIIEQTADVLRRTIGNENVLEHHSGVTFDLDEATPLNMRIARATENWDMPIIVTTAVQFFESLYSNRSSKCRKIHNIANSVIIFDEAQMLPIHNLRPCVNAIAQLVENYNVTAVLCTATQPALNGIFKEFISNVEIKELCPELIYDMDIFKRVKYEYSGTVSDEELAHRLNEQKQVLCVVNSRKKAKVIHDKLDSEGAFYLSTLMIPAQRREALNEIRRRLDTGKVCRVVSTSLIEAGVDIDFPKVYRELTGLDSILQAAGRCNREGRRPPEESVVTVFKDDSVPPLLLQPMIACTEHVFEKYNTIDSKEAVKEYFTELISIKGSAAQDKNGILVQLNNMAISTAADRFRMIDDNTRTVYIPWGDGEKLTERLREGERSRSLFRALGQYGVPVYEPQFKALEAVGALRILEDGSAVLTDIYYYDRKTGLKLNPDSGLAFFN